MQSRGRIAVLLVSLSLLWGQQQPPVQNPPASGGGVKFTSISQLVVENVIVKDKSGNLVEGLEAKDFNITENGVPQKIAFFTFQKLQDEVLVPERSVAAAPLIDNAKEKVAPLTQNQIAPETPGNLKYRDRRLMALYLDMTAMPVPDQLRALGAAQKFINTQMAKADVLPIMEFTGGAVKVLQDFTDDRGE